MIQNLVKKVFGSRSDREVKQLYPLVSEINNFADNNQSVILVGGHYNNWEIFAQGFAISSFHKCIGIYKPLSNKFLNNKLSKSRSKYGMNLISMKLEDL